LVVAMVSEPREEKEELPAAPTEGERAEGEAAEGEEKEEETKEGGESKEVKNENKG